MVNQTIEWTELRPKHRVEYDNIQQNYKAVYEIRNGEPEPLIIKKVIVWKPEDREEANSYLSAVAEHNSKMGLIPLDKAQIRKFMNWMQDPNAELPF